MVLIDRLRSQALPADCGQDSLTRIPTRATVAPMPATFQAVSKADWLPTASMTTSARAPPVAWRRSSAGSPWEASMGKAPSSLAKSSRAGTRSIANTVAGPKSLAQATVRSPTGPAPTTATTSPGPIPDSTQPV